MCIKLASMTPGNTKYPKYKPPAAQISYDALVTGFHPVWSKIYKKLALGIQAPLGVRAYPWILGTRWEYDALSVCWEHDNLSAARCEYDTLSTVWSCCYTRYHNSSAMGSYKNNNNQRYWRSLISYFGEKHLSGGADWSAAKDGQDLPHFQQIVIGGASMPSRPMAAVIYFLCSRS